MAQPSLYWIGKLNALFSFGMSFCSLAYQQVFALTLSDISGDFVLAQALSLGTFLLGMGMGTWRAGKWECTARNLARIEIILSILGLGSAFFLQFLDTLLKGLGFSTLALIICGLPYILAVGFFTGFELPLLLGWGKRVRVGRILGWNYFGALLATASINTLLIPALDVDGVSIVVSLLNFAMAATLVFLYSRNRALIFSSIACAIVLTGAILLQPRWRSLHLKSIYVRPIFHSLKDFKASLNIFSQLGEAYRLRTAYQWIDILPPSFSAPLNTQQGFMLFLDRNLQFSSLNQERYHQSLVHGSINLLFEVPKRVLILGGGDGLLLPVLLSYNEIEHIDLVELDPQMISLALRESHLVKLNKDSLRDPRVNVHIEDAFQFVRKSREPYDLVISDLPFPTNYDLSLLFSVEFFALVKKRVTPTGLFVFDFPAPDFASHALAPIANTIVAAGWRTPIAFGQEDLFVAAATNGRDLHFNYEQLSKKVSNEALFNIQKRGREWTEALATPSRTNSIFFPMRFTRDRELTSSNPRNVVYADSPGLLPLFLMRFRAFNEIINTAAQWPGSLERYWRKNISEPRDFLERLPNGVLWPRFQWVYEFDNEGERHNSVQWFDLKNPEVLRDEWQKAFGFIGDREWVGVTWHAPGPVFEFHETWVENGVTRGWRTRKFAHGKFVEETLQDIKNDGRMVGPGWTQTSPGDDLPFTHHEASRKLMRAVELEFHLPPRAQRLSDDGKTEWLYFP